MTVLNDLREETKAAFARFVESSEGAELPFERLQCYLEQALATHKIYLKFAPFEAELRQAKGAWELVQDGEGRVQKVVPMLLERLGVEIKPAARILSDGKDPWDATKELAENCLENLEENWDDPGELINDFREDWKEWWDDLSDWLDRGIGRV
ncbi:hypothetical protein X769_07585 [Mesorhizobium sp. LSJC268A00]|uniref:hypothetical protein n=1 Tax=unclassified Mesorhizobium TaxID=325217 RepID=UPI0003CE02FA|nr:hypothetical protein [Mesorhizobium sp. LSJC268A00]ESX07223.1 hypothetical protein X769_07585 [Mesorhizobium sp. LSJC268A00]